ncbi:MAG TPA: amidohydrolase family protein [Polyangiaceae bacterium]|nr:amidohydrolase family protein [Polyangiaceae bacterium]
MIIDTHTHFYDPSRPAGVPWPSVNDALLYRPFLPEEYARVIKPFGVVGTVAVECNRPVEQDNAWVLEQADRNAILQAFVGYLDPAAPWFQNELAGCLKHRAFRGLRIHSRDVPSILSSAGGTRGLEVLAECGGVVEVISGRETYANTLALCRAVPKLTVVLNHLGKTCFDDPEQELWQTLRRLASYRNVVAKVSGLLEDAPLDSRSELVYRAGVRRCYEVFGEERLVFGSNWPVTLRYASLEELFRFALELLHSLPATAASAVLLHNAQRVYRLNGHPLG